ncbi:histidine phosphatase family protein [Belliella sp. R4-6]|uniref:Histidine phosphatase family protein n=1 Tax=Belliella alkalica TaxID=1730871 RepID=A0ABS9VH89_9BACT|nr:histidine phosphatase family protein [Belliella alkalica]MCH7415802.1 histidine phosphatase family protein [Belliella alkalica]
MKKLILMRHAKSSWDDPFLDDHQRPLSERGLRDCPRMGQRLKKSGVIPDLYISSDAERAKTTALIVAEQLHFPKHKIQFTRELYHASSSQILNWIRKSDDNYMTLLVFGHNPGFNDLIEDLGLQIDNLPTSGQFGFVFETDTWNNVGQRNAKKWFYDFPKNQ